MSKPRIAVLGTGWGGFSFAKRVSKDAFNVSVVSPRNHFLFTPLLPSTTVGTLEFRCIQEPVRTIKGVEYYQAECTDVNVEAKRLSCREVFKGNRFDLPYDHLVIATGAVSNTFGVPGVNEENHVHFLKQLGDARAIRNRILECFERATSPHLDEEEQQRLLSFVVVGGGPTSIEFTAELYDFVQEDVRRWYPDLRSKVTVTLIEAGDHILGSFNANLIIYTTRLFQNRNIRLLLQTSVKEVRPQEALLGDGSAVPFGLMVWSTGLAPTPLVQSLGLEKQRTRIVVDEHLRVPGHEGVYALGDAAICPANPLPPLAQVADQQGKYLAKVFSELASATATIATPPFKYRHLGSMAQTGQWTGLVDLTGIGGQPGGGSPGGGVLGFRGPALQGILAFLTWRSAYWTKTVSISNKILIPMHWLKSWLFGRDISRF